MGSTFRRSRFSGFLFLIGLLFFISCPLLVADDDPTNPPAPPSNENQNPPPAPPPGGGVGMDGMVLPLPEAAGGLGGVPVNNLCGDGVIDESVGEACDHGNLLNNDGCSSTCKIERCGDGITQTKEECDDGNVVSGDGCSSKCLIDESSCQISCTTTDGEISCKAPGAKRWAFAAGGGDSGGGQVIVTPSGFGSATIVCGSTLTTTDNVRPATEITTIRVTAHYADGSFCSQTEQVLCA